MFKVVLIALLVAGIQCRPQNLAAEDWQQDFEAFKNNLKTKYDEAQNVGTNGLNNFLEFLYQQKQHLDQHYENLKQQGQVTDDVRQRATELKQYLQQLIDQAVDEAKGWTDDAINRAKELAESLKQYEQHRVTPEAHAEQIQQFQNNLRERYEEAKQAGENGYNQFIEYIQNEKAKLDKHYEQMKQDSPHEVTDDIKAQAQALRDYIQELSQKAVDDSQGWTQSAVDKVKEIWESLKGYEQFAEDKLKEGMEHAKQVVHEAFETTTRAA